MAELRCQLREDFDGAAAKAKDLVDWKHYVKRAPWAAMGVAAIAAFAIVPRKLQVTTVDAEAAAELAKQNRVVVRNKPEAAAKGGLGSFLLKTAITMAVRTAIGIATQKVAESGAARPNNPTGSSSA